MKIHEHARARRRGNQLRAHGKRQRLEHVGGGSDIAVTTLVHDPATELARHARQRDRQRRACGHEQPSQVHARQSSTSSVNDVFRAPVAGPRGSALGEAVATAEGPIADGAELRHH